MVPLTLPPPPPLTFIVTIGAGTVRVWVLTAEPLEVAVIVLVYAPEGVHWK
jgi:hypothetical protein